MKKILCFFALLLCLSDSKAGAMGKRPPLDTGFTSAELPALDLHQCFKLALARSETIAIQREDIEEAEAQFFKATGEALGDVDFIMDRTWRDPRQDGGGSDRVGGSFTDPERLESRFQISQPLFRGFRALGALTGAGSLKSRRKQEWIRAQELLFLDVAAGFYALLREREDFATVEEIQRLFDERIKDLGSREEIGRSRASEVVSARSRLKIIEAEGARLRGNAAAAEYVMEFLTGVPWKGRPLPEQPSPAGENPPLDEILRTIENRADVDAARQAVKTAHRKIIVEQSGFWPTLSAEHNQYQRREGIQESVDWEFLLKLDVPLFRGGENVGRVKQAVSLWKKEKLNFSRVKRQAELEIKTNHSNWISSLDESRAFEEAVEASEENFKLQTDEYSHNLVSNLDVLEALESLYQTRREANSARYVLQENYWKLQVSSGNFISNLMTGNS